MLRILVVSNRLPPDFVTGRYLTTYPVSYTTRTTGLTTYHPYNQAPLGFLR